MRIGSQYWSRIPSSKTTIFKINLLCRHIIIRFAFQTRSHPVRRSIFAAPGELDLPLKGGVWRTILGRVISHKEKSPLLWSNCVLNIIIIVVTISGAALEHGAIWPPVQSDSPQHFCCSPLLLIIIIVIFIIHITLRWSIASKLPMIANLSYYFPEGGNFQLTKT